MSRRTQLLASFFVTLALAVGCGGDTSSEYDPEWDATSPIEDGKADGIIDIAPVADFDVPVSGDVGGDRVELFRVQLQRTDRIEVAMTVTSGDLNPHLSLFYGSSSYVSSDTWSRDGDTLRKTYTAEYAGSYLIAARAFRGEGEGDFTITITCAGGPCAGELPPPENDLELDDATTCIARARRCSFSRLEGYGGAVGEVRSRQIFTECMNEASLDDGTSCATACEWMGEDEEYTDDDAQWLCDSITAALPFYADQSQLCLGILDDCMGDCYEAGEWGYGYDVDGIWSTVESLCWSEGFNNSCDSLARVHEACGGHVRIDGARSCYEFCTATDGAHVDDLDTMCSSDADCEYSCDVDIEQGGEQCGGVTSENEECILDWLYDTLEMESCEDALWEMLSE